MSLLQRLATIASLVPSQMPSNSVIPSLSPSRPPQGRPAMPSLLTMPSHEPRMMEGLMPTAMPGYGRVGVLNRVREPLPGDRVAEALLRGGVEELIAEELASVADLDIAVVDSFWMVVSMALNFLPSRGLIRPEIEGFLSDASAVTAYAALSPEELSSFRKAAARLEPVFNGRSGTNFLGEAGITIKSLVEGVRARAKDSSDNLVNLIDRGVSSTTLGEGLVDAFLNDRPRRMENLEQRVTDAFGVIERLFTIEGAMTALQQSIQTTLNVPTIDMTVVADLVLRELRALGPLRELTVETVAPLTDIVAKVEDEITRLQPVISVLLNGIPDTPIETILVMIGLVEDISAGTIDENVAVLEFLASMMVEDVDALLSLTPSLLDTLPGEMTSGISEFLARMNEFTDLYTNYLEVLQVGPDSLQLNEFSDMSRKTAIRSSMPADMMRPGRMVDGVMNTITGKYREGCEGDMCFVP